jgi:hypothetical protein
MIICRKWNIPIIAMVNGIPSSAKRNGISDLGLTISDKTKAEQKDESIDM